MKKIVLLFVTATTMFACAPTEVKTDSAAATGTVTSTGPDVDMLKRGTTAFANGDWATVASNYADTAKSYHNSWPSNTDTTVGVKIPVIIEVFKKQLDQLGLNYSKGAIQLPLDRAFPIKLIQEIVKFRIQENEMKAMLKNRKNTKK